MGRSLLAGTRLATARFRARESDAVLVDELDVGPVVRIAHRKAGPGLPCLEPPPLPAQGVVQRRTGQTSRGSLAALDGADRDRNDPAPEPQREGEADPAHRWWCARRACEGGLELARRVPRVHRSWVQDEGRP